MVKLRPARGGRGWEVDIRFSWPEGGRFRERVNAPVKAKSAAERWAAAREAAILAAGKTGHLASKAPAVPVDGAPTLDTFWPRVVTDHYRANRKKASTIDAAESIYRNHLAALAAKRLDAIGAADIAALKGRLSTKGPKTVNNVLSVLSRALRCAVSWGVIPVMPCRIELLNAPAPARDWYELEEFRRLVEATWGLASRALVLLAGSAGLRRGEIIALRWSHVDLTRRQVDVREATWRKVTDTPKGGRSRLVPMTDELATALGALKRGRGVATLDGDDHVLVSERGGSAGLSNRTIRNWLARTQRRAGLEETGGIHTLRHTFCSHLAIAGVPAKAIQELAGHADLATTQRYMHLSPANRSAAIATLGAFYNQDKAPASARRKTA